jgi:hypothetical protein
MKFEKLAALGAIGACGGIAVVYAGLAWLGLPTAFAGVPGATGGIDPINRSVLWIAAAVPVSLFVIAHLGLAKQLFRGPSSFME